MAFKKDILVQSWRKKNYSTLLKNPKWQKKRLEIFQRDKWKCRLCGDKENTLHVHHLAYGEFPWSINERFLITVCEDCHKTMSK